MKNNDSNKYKGRLFVISGPSGVGKSSLIEDVLEMTEGFIRSISVTTRQKRASDFDLERYRFVSEEEFQKMIEERKLLEWAEYSNFLYGTPKDFVINNLKAGINVLLEIEVNGAMQIKNKIKDAYFIFITTTTLDQLKQRLIKRGTENIKEIEKRMKIAREEIKYQKYYNCIIVNNNYNEALQNLIKVLNNNKGGK